MSRHLAAVSAIMERYEAVSYTHLDVYKRQIIMNEQILEAANKAAAAPCSFLSFANSLLIGQADIR